MASMAVLVVSMLSLTVMSPLTVSISTRPDALTPVGLTLPMVTPLAST